MRIQASTRGVEAACPACGVVSRRVHSRYQRRLADTAAGGQEILVHLQVRRFLCRNGHCAKTTFAEQIPGLAARYGRRTCSLDGTLRAIALALGGRARVAAERRAGCPGQQVDAAAAHPRPARPWGYPRRGARSR